MRRRANAADRNPTSTGNAASSEAQNSAAERLSEMQECIRENVAVEVRFLATYFFMCNPNEVFDVELLYGRLVYLFYFVLQENIFVAVKQSVCSLLCILPNNHCSYSSSDT